MTHEQLVGIGLITSGLGLVAVYFRIRSRDRRSIQLKAPKATITSSQTIVEMMRRMDTDPPGTRMPEPTERNSPDIIRMRTARDQKIISFMLAAMAVGFAGVLFMTCHGR